MSEPTQLQIATQLLCAALRANSSLLTSPVAAAHAWLRAAALLAQEQHRLRELRGEIVAHSCEPEAPE